MSKKADIPHLLTLPPDTTFKVEVVPPTKPPTVWDQLRPVAYYAFATAIIIEMVAWLFLAQPNYAEPSSEPSQPSAPTITLTYPQYISRGDEGVIDATVTNVAAQPLSGTLVLAFGSPPPITTLDDSTNVLLLKNLPPQGNQSLHVRYRIAQPATAFSAGLLSFTPTVTLDTGERTTYQTQSITVTPIPLVRTLLNGVLGLAALYGLLWVQIQKRLFPSK